MDCQLARPAAARRGANQTSVVKTKLFRHAGQLAGRRSLVRVMNSHIPYSLPETYLRVRRSLCRVCK